MIFFFSSFTHLRCCWFRFFADGIENLKKLAAAGSFYTVSLPSVLTEPDSSPLYSSASACALLASRFEEHVQMTMSPGRDRVLAVSYTLPVVPARCPSPTPLPRVALDEVLFNTTASLHFPEEGPKPLGKVHEASFLPPAAAAAAGRAAQQAAAGGGGGGGGAGGEVGPDGQPAPPQSFLRKYWMYILPVVVLMTMGGGEEPAGDGKGGGGEGGGGGARPAAAGGAARRR